MKNIFLRFFIDKLTLVLSFTISPFKKIYDILECYLLLKKISERALERYNALLPRRNFLGQGYFYFYHGNLDQTRVKKPLIISEINLLVAYPIKSTNDLMRESELCLRHTSIFKKQSFGAYTLRPGKFD